jgi:hypothetical protein
MPKLGKAMARKASSYSDLLSFDVVFEQFFQIQIVYFHALGGQVITVSLETQKCIAGLPPLMI